MAGVGEMQANRRRKSCLRQRAEAGRVCGWGAGNSLDSRDDLWELGQTHKRTRILGKSQLLPLFLEILRKIQQADCQCEGKLFSIC